MPIIQIKSDTSESNVYRGLYHFRSAPWWLPNGINPSNVIAAYQFMRVSSEADALLNQNNQETLPLTKVGTVTWDPLTGYFFPATNGYGLNNANLTSFLSAFVRFSDVDTSTDTVAPLVAPAVGYRLEAKTAVYQGGTVYYRKTPGFLIADTGGSTLGGYSAAAYSNGVLGWIRNAIVSSNVLYMNGISLSYSGSIPSSDSGRNYITIGQSRHMSYPTHTSLKIQAVAFYNVALTAAQAVELSQSMAEL